MVRAERNLKFANRQLANFKGLANFAPTEPFPANAV
jgi:hypothetical protein